MYFHRLLFSHIIFANTPRLSEKRSEKRLSRRSAHIVNSLIYMYIFFYFKCVIRFQYKNEIHDIYIYKFLFIVNTLEEFVFI